MTSPYDASGVANRLQASKEKAKRNRDNWKARAEVLERENAVLRERMERVEAVVEAAREVASYCGAHEMGDFEGTDFGTAHGELDSALAALDSEWIAGDAE